MDDADWYAVPKYPKIILTIEFEYARMSSACRYQSVEFELILQRRLYKLASSPGGPRTVDQQRIAVAQ